MADFTAIHSMAEHTPTPTHISYNFYNMKTNERSKLTWNILRQSTPVYWITISLFLIQWRKEHTTFFHLFNFRSKKKKQTSLIVTVCKGDTEYSIKVAN